MTQRRKRLIRTTILLVLLAGGVVVYWQREALSLATGRFVAMNRSAPTDVDLLMLYDGSADKIGTVEAMWAAETIPHRAYSMSRLSTNPALVRDNWTRVRPMVLEAFTSGDLDVQTAAMSMIRTVDQEAADRWAVRLTQDVDSGVRRAGLYYITDHAPQDPRFVHTLLDLLNDPDPAVVAIAAGTLRRCTGEDFGIRFANSAEANREGVARWNAWWQEHRAKFPPPHEPADADSLTKTSLQAPDIELTNLDGQPIDLEALRGQVVVLHFWATWQPHLERDAEAMTAFARQHAGNVTVIAINMDQPGEPAVGEVLPEVLRFVRTQQPSYSIALDATGEASRRYASFSVPTTAWIDADGALRRRYTGARTIEVLEDILGDISGGTPVMQADRDSGKLSLAQ